jgi:alpha-galactosidase
MAWQFDRPEAGGGVVQVFRRAESIYEAARLRLRGLNPDATYRLADLDRTDAGLELSGRELMETGLLVVLRAQPGSAVWTYERIGSVQ